MRKIKNHSFNNNQIFIFKEEKKTYENFYKQDINCHNAWKNEFEKNFISNKTKEEKEDFYYYLEYNRTSQKHEMGVFQVILVPFEIGLTLAIFQFDPFAAAIIVFLGVAIILIPILLFLYYNIANKVRFLDEIINTFFKEA